MQERDVFPSVISVEDDDEEEQVSPSKFKQMREQQMMAELTRADANLKAVKVFRVNNEKHYKDKELRELRKKEIREPLEEAYTVIEVLQGKLARRDDLIHKLRKYISVDMLKANQTSFEDTKTKVIEFNQQEEHNEMVLQDSISEFEKAVEHLNAKIERHKGTISQQWERIKSLSTAIESQELNHKEQIRTIESDKILYLSQLQNKENVINNLTSDRDNQKNRGKNLDKELTENKQRLQHAQEKVQQQAHLLKEAEAEYKLLHQKYATTEDNFLECQDTLTELEERYTNLRTRYETLVAELDEMVEGGYIIPSADELQAAKKGNKKDSMKRQTSIKLTKGKSGKFTREKSMIGGAFSLNAGSSSVDGGGSFGESNSIGEEAPATFTTNNTTAFTNNNTATNTANSTALNSPAGVQPSGFSENTNASAKYYANPGSNKFNNRMQQEDAMFDQKLIEGRAARRGDALSMELTRDISSLKQQLSQQQADHNEALRQAQAAKQSLESAQMIVSTELRRVTARNQELSTVNHTLKDELQEKEQHIETLEEKTTALHFQVEALERKLVPSGTEVACGPDSPPSTPPRSPSNNADGIVFDDDLATSAEGEQGDQVYDHDFDVNEYMQMPMVDATTQIGASEFADADTQFPFLDDPDFVPNDQNTQTNPADVLYPTEYYLETLFRDYIAESQTHIPTQNLHILQLSRLEESNKEKASRLGGKHDEDPQAMTEEAATFRVKRAIGYVGALNELRNKHIRYINQTGAWNVANARMVVRCIDLVLQTTHNILCPQVMIEDSEYPELRFATDRGETNYYSDEGEPEDDAHAFGLIKDITTKWRKSAKGAIRKDSTFPLTESELVTDHNYGAPKGILTHEGQSLSKAVKKYMNRSVQSARKIMTNVDQLLDVTEAEERARTASPTAERARATTPHRKMSGPPRSANTANGSRASSRASSFSGPGSPGGRSIPSAPHASPLISAFAAKVLAVANFAYGSDSSPESSPKHTSRKISTVIPIPELSGASMEFGDIVEHIEGLDGRDFEPLALYSPPPTMSPAQTAAVVQGYYNFGNERPSSIEESLNRAQKVQTVDLTAAEVGLMGDAVSNLKVKFKDDRSVGVSFHVNDDSDDEEGTLLLEAFKQRKHSRAAAKKGFVGTIRPTADYVDYVRVPFSPHSVENMPFKKCSATGAHGVGVGTGTPMPARKASAGSAAPRTPVAVIAYRHNSTGHYSPSMEARIRSLNQSPDREREQTPALPLLPPVASAIKEEPAQETVEEKFTHFPFPDAVLPAHTELNRGSLALENEGDLEELTVLSMNNTSDHPSHSSYHNRSYTPTFADHADQLQRQLEPLPPPSPTHLTESVSVHPVAPQLNYAHPDALGRKSSTTTPKHKGLSSGGGLKGLLQRNIDASAMAVYELQDQQRQRERAISIGTAPEAPTSAPLTGFSLQAKGTSAGGMGSVRPPQHSRPSSSKASVRNGRHMSKEINWAGPACIPVVITPGQEGMEAVGASAVSAVPSSTASPAAASIASKPPPIDTSDVSLSRARSRGDSFQLPTDGSVDLNKMFSGSHRGHFDPQDEVVIRQPSPAQAAAPREAQVDMTVAGQRRTNISKKEKVTNAVLFM